MKRIGLVLAMFAAGCAQEPDPRETEVYAQLLPIFDGAFAALTGSFDALAEGLDLGLVHGDNSGGDGRTLCPFAAAK